MKPAKERGKVCVLLILLFACLVTVVVTVRQHNVPATHGSASIDPRIHWPALPPLPNWSKWEPPSDASSPSSRDNSAEVESTFSTKPFSGGMIHRSADSLSLRTFPTPSSHSLTIGFVNVNRLLATYPPTDDSKEARAEAITDFQHVIACRAEAHDCTIVFDISGRSLNGVSPLLGAEQSFDLTEEVLDQLIAEHSIQLLSETH